ncbi:uncharacterized protein LOC118466998 [Anopheles albimanus]|uniref:Uncharacterized protein n=1 Tax=Anopheles albimanus TaxID=7167 RepID=A0A3F2YQ51_ANOAL|nr:uncharacterized protein LOC118466998 [Anopheles albimanus]
MALNCSCQTRSRRAACGCLPQHASHELDHEMLDQHHHQHHQHQHRLRKQNHHDQQPSTTRPLTMATNGQSLAMAAAAAAAAPPQPTLNTSAACQPATTSRRRPTPPRWRPWRSVSLPLLPVLLLLLLLVVLVRPWPGASGAPVATKEAAGGQMLKDFLDRTGSDWLDPCRPANRTPSPANAVMSGQPQTNNDTSVVRRKIVVAMMETTQLALVTFSQSADELNHTGWSDEKRQRKYTFLRPFVSNVTTWERRLSVYWAFLAFIVNVYETQSNVDPIKPVLLEDMRTLRNYIKDILCQVREYQSFAFGKESFPKPIKPERMSKLIQFDEVDLSEIEVDRWFVMCRLHCYLNSIYTHLKRVNQTKHANPEKMVSKKTPPRCTLCPYLRKGPGSVDQPDQEQEHPVSHQAMRKQQRKANRRKEQQLGITTDHHQRQQQQQQQSRPKANNKGQSGAGKKATNQAGGKRRKGDTQGKRQKQQQPQQQQQQQQQVGGLALDGAAAKAPTAANQRAKAKNGNRKRKNHQPGQQQQRHGGGGGKRPNRVQD